MATDTTYVELFICSLMIAVTAVHAVLRLRRKQDLSSLDVAIWAFPAFFALGTFYAFFHVGHLPPERVDILLQAYLSVALFMVGIWLMQIITSRLRRKHHAFGPMFETLQDASRSGVLLMAIVYSLALASQIYVGYVFNRFTSDDVSRQSYHAFEAADYLLETPMYLGKAVFIAAAAYLFSRRRIAVIPLLIVIADFLVSFTIGRRLIVQNAIVLGLCYVVFRPIQLKTAVVALLMFLVLILFALPFFQRMRYYKARTPTGDNAVMKFATVVETAWRNPDAEGSDRDYSSNAGQRPLYIFFNCDIIAALEHRPMMMGNAFAASMVNTVPYMLYPGKRDWLDPESNLIDKLALRRTDSPVTLPAFAMADFGQFGCLFGGMLFGAVLWLIELLARWMTRGIPILGTILFAAVIESAIQVQTYPSILVGHVRNAFFFMIFVIPLFPLLFATRPSLRARLAAEESAEGFAPEPQEEYEEPQHLGVQSGTGF